MTQLVVDPASVALVEKYRRWIDNAPNWIVEAVKTGLNAQNRLFISRFRASLEGKFKVKRTKVGNAFRGYVAGDKIDNLYAGVFTRWVAAKIYEYGGTITGNRAMAFPINPRAYTADGRVKTKWHDPRNFPDLFFVKLKRGAAMLVQGKKQVTSAVVAQRTGVDIGVFRAWEPMFLLIYSTARRAVLSFFQDFAALAAERGAAIEQIIGRRLETEAAKLPEK